MPQDDQDKEESRQDEKDSNTPRFATSLEKGFQRLVTPFQEFVRAQTTSSVSLIICTVTAIVLANSPLSHAYHSFFESKLGVYFGEHVLEKTLHFWINDALMALFFFTLGLEIKREILVGELKDPKRSMLIIVSALGGMLVPAMIYFLLNIGSPAARGWGIPMATDTAFVVGIMAFLGTRVLPAVMTFLVALAIVDDIGAVLVIALFYTDQIVMHYLLYAGVSLGLLIFLNFLNIRTPLPYFLLGALVWFFVLQSGVHSTIAGILVAFAIPARPRYGPSGLLKRLERLTARLRQKQRENTHILADEEQHAVVQTIRDTARMAMTPLQRWENALERPVALFLIPVFALANIGISLHSQSVIGALTDPVTLGIVLGLIVGKLTGIAGFCWAGMKLGLGRLPEGMRMADVVGVGLLAGMGFTMSIFIAGLSFGLYPEEILLSKIGIVTASFISGLSGFLWFLGVSLRNSRRP